MADFFRSYSFWLVLAVLVFWAVGAHNRLVRLRAEIQSALTQIQTEWAQCIGALSPLFDEASGIVEGAAARDSLAMLRAALIQVEAALADVRARSFDTARVAALAASSQAFSHAWERSHTAALGLFGDANGTGGRATLQADVVWTRSRVMLGSAARNFDAAVGAYNAAIAQFPAALLARVFGFRPARGLGADA